MREFAVARTRLRFNDQGRPVSEVHLLTELWKREPPRRFVRVGEAWELDLGVLPVDRLEYELELVFADGRRARQLDPAVPTVDAPFGPKSVWSLEAYQPPSWLRRDAPAGVVQPLELESALLAGRVSGQLWSPGGLPPETPAPLLVAHDGPEYGRLAALTRFLEIAVATKTLPPLRAALLAPRARNEDYSASPRYTDALATELVPALERRVATTTRIGLGASLGGLAMLHAHRQHPRLFQGLVLQSGSFFQRALDVHEHGFSRFERIDAFVRDFAAVPGVPVPVGLTCGAAEENFANNEAMARVLEGHGYPVRLHTVRDVHTWTCWRDALAEGFAAVRGAL